tara:strand:- start:249 stop:662 length:414 start_codon:yes stop_codon:yes gene_type:complete
MEKFLYFRGATAVSADQDETSGSVIYPVSSIMGITAGDAVDPEGNITDDDDRFTIFFKPARIPGGGDPAAAGNDRPDHIVFDVTSGDFDFKNLYQELVDKINDKPHKSGMIVVFDGVTGTGITGITGIHQVTMNVVD